MSDLQPRRRGSPSRRERAGRAYTLVRVTGALLALTIVLFVLALLGIVGGGYAFLAGVLTVGAGVVLRRTLSS
jgi:hypothetical protein